MDVKRWKADGWVSVHEDTALVHPAFTREELNASFKVYWAIVKKGTEGHLHQHPESEMVAVVDGRCAAVVEEEEEDVGKGDVVLIPPNSAHSIRNVNQDDACVLVIKFNEL